MFTMCIFCILACKHLLIISENKVQLRLLFQVLAMQYCTYILYSIHHKVKLCLSVSHVRIHPLQDETISWLNSSSICPALLGSVICYYSTVCVALSTVCGFLIGTRTSKFIMTATVVTLCVQLLYRTGQDSWNKMCTLNVWTAVLQN